MSVRSELKQWSLDNNRIVTLISGLVLALGTALLTFHVWAAIGLIAVAVIAGFAGERLRDKSEKGRETSASSLAQMTSRALAAEAAATHARTRFADSAESWVEAIAIWAGLDSEARVSLYVLRGPSWTRVARFSSNLLYKESGRGDLPKGQGVLHQAHLLGEYVLDNLPSFEEDERSYLAEQRKLFVPVSVCRELVMRSRSYAAFAFGREGTRSRPYALVFESTDPSGLDSDALSELLHAEARQALGTLSAIVREPTSKSAD